MEQKQERKNLKVCEKKPGIGKKTHKQGRRKNCEVKRKHGGQARLGSSQGRLLLD
jgi:hypothetical protein